MRIRENDKVLLLNVADSSVSDKYAGKTYIVDKYTDMGYTLVGIPSDLVFSGNCLKRVPKYKIHDYLIYNDEVVVITDVYGKELTNYLYSIQKCCDKNILHNVNEEELLLDDEWLTISEHGIIKNTKTNKYSYIATHFIYKTFSTQLSQMLEIKQFDIVKLVDNNVQADSEIFKWITELYEHEIIQLSVVIRFSFKCEPNVNSTYRVLYTKDNKSIIEESVTGRCFVVINDVLKKVI